MVGQSQKIGIALEAAELGLGLVEGAAQVIPFPYAQQGTELARKILSATQLLDREIKQARNDKEDYAQLDKDLRELVGVVDGLMARAQSIERKKSLSSLVCLLTELINLELERTSRNAFLRVLTSGADVAKIKNCREQIGHAACRSDSQYRCQDGADDRQRAKERAPKISVLPAPSSLPTLPPVWTVFNNPVGNFIDLRSEGTVTVMTLNGVHLMTTKD
ncbi:hypothetical protein C8R46DRAFT_1041182 [Mycena filopes]|nr:hypothetical protein C8R46DRAFT_1041182 [Mycena filopes]